MIEKYRFTEEEKANLDEQIAALPPEQREAFLDSKIAKAEAMVADRLKQMLGVLPMMPDRAGCEGIPDFLPSDDNVEEILSWAGAEVSWSPTRNGDEDFSDGGFWSFGWKFGFGAISPRREDEVLARKYAAFYIYLYAKGFEPAGAGELASMYCGRGTRCER